MEFGESTIELFSLSLSHLKNPLYQENDQYRVQGLSYYMLTSPPQSPQGRLWCPGRSILDIVYGMYVTCLIVVYVIL